MIDTGRASLAEMRRLLRVARDGSDGDRRLAPQPGLVALPALIDQVRAAGTPVTLQLEGDPVPLPTAVDLSAYRIVQEALTNTRKHAGADAGATVRLAFQVADLEIDVVDDGYGTPVTRPTAEGNGLRGITERVGALDGTIDVGPRPDGGFRVHVLLPLASPEAQPEEQLGAQLGAQAAT